MNRKFLLVVILIIVLVLIIWVVWQNSSPAAAQGAGRNLSGFFWSSNIGWARANEVVRVGDSDFSYGLTLSGNNISGYMWSPNIGWINFDPNTNEPGAPLPTLPGGGAVTNRHGAKISSDGSIIGWARACSVFVSGCSGDLRSLNQRGGWDGWISLRGTNHPGQGNINYGLTFINNRIEGLTWANDNVGWIGCTAGSSWCPKLEDFTVTCKADPNPQQINQAINWTITSGQETGGQYSYLWTELNSDGTETPLGTGASMSNSYSTAGQYEVTVKVTDNNSTPGDTTDDTTGSGQCLVNVEDNTQKKLQILPGGDAQGRVFALNAGGISCSSDSDPSDNGCWENFAGAPTVNLRAASGVQGVNIILGGGCNTSGGSPQNCSVTMNSNKTVTATFDAPGGSSPTISTNKEVVRIREHAGGTTANSDRAQITNGGTSPATVCVISSQSKITVGKKLDNLFGDGSSQNPKCNLSNSSSVVATPCELTRATIPAGESYDFFVTVPHKDIEVLQHSPYNLNLGVDPGSGTCQQLTPPINIEFRYEVPDIRPR